MPCVIIFLSDLRRVGQLQLNQGAAAPDRGARGCDADRVHHREPVELPHAARLRPLRRTGHLELNRHLRRENENENEKPQAKPNGTR